MSMSKIKVIHFPYGENNSYQSDIIEETRRLGIDAVGASNTVKYLILKLFEKGNIVIHLHWVSNLATDSNVGLAILKMVFFFMYLAVWRMSGKKIVWTIHNLVNHEKKRVWLDKLNSIIIGNISNKVIVHGQSVVGVVSDLFKIKKEDICVVFHGNYSKMIEWKPMRENRPLIKFMVFGFIRRYKGVVELLEEIKKIPRDFYLIIAGQISDEDLKQEIVKLARKDSRVALEMRYMEKCEVNQLLEGVDVLILPYLDIFTSGNLLLAMTAGRPVIAPSIGLIPEYVDESCAFLYDPSNENGLSDAINEALNATSLNEMGRLAYEKANQFTWQKSAAELVNVYNSTFKFN